MDASLGNSSAYLYEVADSEVCTLAAGFLNWSGVLWKVTWENIIERWYQRVIKENEKTIRKQIQYSEIFPIVDSRD